MRLRERARDDQCLVAGFVEFRLLPEKRRSEPERNYLRTVDTMEFEELYTWI